MTLLEALHEFDTAPEALPDYPEQPGTTRCCGIPVVMRNGIEITCYSLRPYRGKNRGTVDHFSRRPRRHASTPPRSISRPRLPLFNVPEELAQMSKGRNRAICMGCGREFRKPRNYTGKDYRCPECRAAKSAASEPDPKQLIEMMVDRTPWKHPPEKA